MFLVIIICCIRLFNEVLLDKRFLMLRMIWAIFLLIFRWFLLSFCGICKLFVRKYFVKNVVIIVGVWFDILLILFVF